VLNAIKRLTGWPWFERDAEKAPMQTGWESEPWFWRSRLFQIDREIATVKTAIETAKRTKRARRHLYAKLHDLTTERLRIERGL
jgi:hypothetical protein